MTTRPVIEIRGLCNRFGSQVVHENLDLDVQAGEILGIIGGSGSGKSVLLRSIAGLQRPQSGTIRLLGEDVLAGQHNFLQQLGVLFQQGALFSSLSVLDNIALPLVEHAGLSRREANHLAHLKLSLVGLPSLASDKYPADLSGGMVKRAALARALALDPAVLLLDEPTAGLDPIGAAAFDTLIRTLRDALGLTVFMVTHDLDSLCAITDRIAVLAERRVLVHGPLVEVSQNDYPWLKDYFHGPRGRALGPSASFPSST